LAYLASQSLLRRVTDQRRVCCFLVQTSEKRPNSILRSTKLRDFLLRVEHLRCVNNRVPLKHAGRSMPCDLLRDRLRHACARDLRKS
jgi:hypothetical protein